MNKTSFIIAVYIFFCFTAFSQQRISFGDWPKQNDSVVSLTVLEDANGQNQYQLEAKTEKGYSVWKDIKVDYTKNFSLEVGCKRTGLYSDIAFGVLLGFKDFNNYKEIVVLNENKYKITDRYQGISRGNIWKDKETSYSSDIRLKIVKIDRWLLFYINNTFVDKLLTTEFSGTDIGLTVDGAMTAIFSNMTLKELDAPEVKTISNAFTFSQPKEVPTVLFRDDFENNDNFWMTVDNQAKFLKKVVDGTYLFENRNTYGNGSFLKLYLPPSGFELQATAIHESGLDSTYYGLFWGHRDWSNYQEFTITRNGKCRYIKAFQGDITTKNNIFTPSSAMATDTLRVSVIGAVAHFYINGKEVFTAPFEPSAANNAGFLVYNKQRIRFDNLKLMANLSQTTYTRERVDNFDLMNSPNTLSASPSSNSTEIFTMEQNGKLICTRLKKNGNFLRENVRLNTDCDFVITQKIRFDTGEKDKGFGILWGYKDWDNENEFLISGSGMFNCLSKSNGKTWTSDWRKSPFINDTLDNVLEIRRRNTRVEYYINSHLVCVGPFLGFFGPVVGLMQYGSNSVELSSFSVREQHYPVPNFERKTIVLEHHCEDSTGWKLEEVNTADQQIEVKSGKLFVNARFPDLKEQTSKEKGSSYDIGAFTYTKVAETTSWPNKPFYKLFPDVLPPLETEISNFGTKNVKTKDFRVELTTRHIREEHSIGIGLYIGGIPFITDGYKCRIGSWESSNVDVLKDASTYHLAVESRNGNMSFYINDELVLSRSSLIPDLSNRKVGPLVYASKWNTVAWFDDLIVTTYE